MTYIPKKTSSNQNSFDAQLIDISSRDYVKICLWLLYSFKIITRANIFQNE